MDSFPAAVATLFAFAVFAVACAFPLRAIHVAPAITTIATTSLSEKIRTESSWRNPR
jgi:hypothetical protein